MAASSRSPRRRGTSRGAAAVLVRDVRVGRTTRVGGGPAGFAFDPAVSPDGRWVAYALRSSARARSARIHLHDLRTGADAVLSGDGYASEPAVSDGGTRVAWSTTAAVGGKPAGLAGVVVGSGGSSRLVSSHAPLKGPAVGRAARHHAW